jgi:hypothetical protein
VSRLARFRALLTREDSRMIEILVIMVTIPWICLLMVVLGPNVLSIVARNFGQ